MATREFSISLPDELVTQLEAGEVEPVADYLGEAVRNQVRRAAVLDYLATCESAGHAPLSDADLREFRKLVGEEGG